MGSKKYPQEGAYDEHLTNKGGQANAFTTFEKTTYHFSVQYSGLEKALDMLSSYISAPLLLEEAMDREINAINEEYQMYFE